MNTLNLILKQMDLPSADEAVRAEAVPKITFFLSVMAIAGLGSVAKLLNDHQDAPMIQRRIWFTYLTTGLLAGLVIALILYHNFGPSYLLIGVAGLAGFQAVQTLTFLGLALKSLAERIFKK